MESGRSEDVLQRLGHEAVAALKRAIVDAGGNEIFCLGTSNNAEQITDVRVLARGNRSAAPALLNIARCGEVVIHNHPSGRLTPSDADLEIAAALGNNGVGFYIIDNDVSDVYVVVEPHRAESLLPLDPEAVAELLGPNGRISRRLNGYEHRPQQLAMARAVARAFNDDQILTVEAGTGTGKSLAYLVPAILWSLANRERVIVSTHTINLQEQLIHKDLPFLIREAGLKFSAALVKGRGNYLCQRKAHQIETQGSVLLEDEITMELRAVLEWSKKTNDGSRADLAFQPRPEVWEQVVSENDNCLRARCPFYQSCFFYTSRRNAAAADLIVVNHHLLMADLALREETGNHEQNAVLPPARRLVIDEAHHLEHVATSYFGRQLSQLGLDRILARLRSAKNPSKGVLPALVLALGLIEQSEDVMIAQGAIDWIDKRLLPGRASLGERAQECFARVLGAYALYSQFPVSENGEVKLRITSAVRQTEFWHDADRLLNGLAEALDRYASDMLGVLERLESLSPASEKQVLYMATELQALQSRLRAVAASIVDFFAEDEDQCRWIELRRTDKGTSLSLHMAPIDVAPLLHRTLFDRFCTVTLASATLSVDREFRYLHDRTGVSLVEPAERSVTLSIESPFDYGQQALLLTPDDLPDPASSNYEPATHEAIARAIEITGGGTLVLFTSYGALNRACEVLKGTLERNGIVLLRQGEDNRHALLARFSRKPRAVLCATDSFWEGIDVKGDALRCVIIARLPFKVPTEPIEEARVEAIQSRGGNPFFERSLPEAALKLKQGFGRLIRSRKDRGCVLILDSRVIRKRYGRVFLDTLPPARHFSGSLEAVMREMTDFFAMRFRK